MRRALWWSFLLAVGLPFCFAGCDTGDDDDSGDDDATPDDDTPADDDDDNDDTTPDDSPFTHTFYEYTFPEALHDVATGDFYEPAFRYEPIAVEDKFQHVLNFQITPMMPPWLEAMPTNGPLVLYADDFETIVFSPVDSFFISVVDFAGGKIRYGIEGEVNNIPAGFTHRFVLARGPGIRATLEYWGDVLRAEYGKTRPDRYDDIGLAYLGYWTDNGAYYYYRTEPGMNEAETLLAVADDARDRDIPYGYFQIDSWWYFKEPGLLSPGGLIRWEPQPPMFPDGLTAFQQELGLPLIAHNRWLALENDYVDDYEFYFDREMALPLGRPLYDHFMDDAVEWGIETYEQDWLVAQYWGVKYLRNHVAHGRQWMLDMHAAVADHGLTMQLCMSGAVHLLSALEMPRATTIRTSIDYRRGLSKESYWPQFHTVNVLAWAIGVWPFKDNFHSSERFGEAEALISALSAGMVGAGDRLGAADATLLRRTCRSDGLLLKPDRPALPLDAMFLPHQRPYLTSTFSAREGLGRWVYLAAYHLAANHPERTIVDRVWALASYGFQDVGKMFVFPGEVTDWQVDLEAELDIARPVVAYNWRTGKARRVDGTLDLAPIRHLYDHDYYILAPIFANNLALLGETEKFVTLADKRFEQIEVLADAIRVTVAGVPGETVTLKAFDVTAARLIEAAAVITAAGTATVELAR